MRYLLVPFAFFGLVACSSLPSDALDALPDPGISTRAVLPWTTLQNGSSGRDVISLQYLLRARGQSLTVDGAFGNGTQTAVRNIQSANALTVNGIAAASTWEKLIVTVQNGSSGDAVRAVQDQLANRYGYSTTVDGAFGGGTKGNLQNFQRSRDLTDDGIVSVATWSALTTSKAAVKLTDADARARLTGAGFSIVSSGNCSDRNNSTCTALDQIRAATIRGAISFKSLSGCALTVTGGTETGHANGTFTHYNGYKMDFSLSSCNTNYVQTRFGYIGLRGDGAAQYQSPQGDVYAKEGDHWDVVFY
jgi:peptidoglycan hydrolase-like protein with peptidoglycan-binding domain